jgi:signal transduction histidine kinase
MGRVARHILLPFLLVVGVAGAELGWWITFQVRAASQYADVRRELVLLQAKQNANQPTQKVLASIDEEADRRVRMFVLEGMFFFALLILGVVLILRVMRREVSLARAHANFLAAVTHELQSPLASIRLAAETLELRNHDEATKRYTDRMLKDVARLQNLVKNLLASATTGGKVQTRMAYRTSVDDVLIEVAREFIAQDPEWSGGVVVDANAPEACVDVAPERLRVIFVDLLENARKYVHKDRTPQINVVTRAHAARVEFDLRDNGIGLLHHDCERIFDQFYRVGDERVRETSGSGLGLYLVRAMLREAGGDIVAHSEGVGCGACMKAWLPRKFEEKR